MRRTVNGATVTTRSVRRVALSAALVALVIYAVVMLGLSAVRLGRARR